MAEEFGHHASRSYMDQNGAFHLNGAAFFNDAEADISASLEVLNDIAPGELGFLDGVVAGTFAASKAMVLDANGDGTMPDAGDISVGTTTGTKIGTAFAQKLGFWNAAPVIQQAGAAQTAVTDNTGGSVADAIAAVVTAPGALTVTDGAGTNDGTIGAITADASVIAAVQELAAAQEANRLAIIALTDGLAKTIELVNAVRAALTTTGIIKGAA